MPISHRKKWIAGLCAGLTLVVVGAVWANRSHELLEHATRLTEGQFIAYAWSSPEKVVLLMPTPAGENQAFVQRDTRTGQQTLGTFEGSVQNALGWRASPDGQRLVYAADSASFYVVGMGETERAQRSFDVSDYNSYDSQNTQKSAAVWLPDSRRWLGWTPQQTKTPLRLFSVDAPLNAAVAVTAPKGMTALLGVTPDLLAVQVNVSTSNTGKAALATFGIYPNRAPVKSLSLSLPISAEVKEVELSQQGDRLAWLFLNSRRSPLVTMLVRLMPSLAPKFPPTAGLSLWVSRRDGTEMQEVGFEQTALQGKNNNIPFEVRWNPDGKHLSFRMNQALYSVPAP